MPFSTDTIALAGDPLQTARDARALARLICLKEAAPLAIGIFGAWGSGKSTFMQQVEGEIRTILRPRRQRGGDEDGPFVQKVVHIRFNAWQFVDANLWASLTAEFFDQLRAGGWDRAPGARYAGLVERVNLHVHSLTKDAEARHIAAGEGGAKVLEAQKERDAATSDAGAALRKTLGQAAIDLLADLYEENKNDLAVLGRRAGKVDTERAVSTIVEVARGSNSIGGQIASIVGVLSKSPLRMATTIGALVLLATSALVIWHYGARIDLARLITSGFVTLASISTLALAVAPALRVVGKITRRGAEIAGKIDDADKEAAKKLLAAEMTLREATAEAEALALAAQRADQALARYVAPDVNSNPPRLLRYVLEDDPDTRALDAEIGLMGRTRRLFEAIDKIARDERESRRKPPAPAGTGASAAHGDEVETGRAGVDVPDRIILYIDDLDRCTEAQVYAVLQAIHLLLAFDLFAVVVGVDVRWVENALLSGMAGGGRRQTNAERAAAKQRAVEYLEKIFQVAFWLDRLGSGGADGGTHGRLVRALAGNLAPTSAPAPAPTPADTGGASDAENAPPPETAAQDPAASPRAEGPDLQADDAVADAEDGDPGLLETIQLERVEVEFLASPAIAGFAAATPRGVKRMINVYRLVRTRIAEDGDLWPEGRPLYPLIALAAAVETGQSLEVANGLLSWLAALPADKQLSRTTAPGKSGLDYPEGWGGTDKEPVLRDLLERIARLRDGDVQAKDLLSVVKLARRFSFQPPA